MFISTKLLPVLALAVSTAPPGAQARNNAQLLMHQANTTQMTPDCWATNFGFTLQRTERLDTEAKDSTLCLFIFAFSSTCRYLDHIGRLLNEREI
jgi:hypothetical protein